MEELDYIESAKKQISKMRWKMIINLAIGEMLSAIIIYLIISVATKHGVEITMALKLASIFEAILFVLVAISVYCFLVVPHEFQRAIVIGKKKKVFYSVLTVRSVMHNKLTYNVLCNKQVYQDVTCGAHMAVFKIGRTRTAVKDQTYYEEESEL